MNPALIAALSVYLSSDHYYALMMSQMAAYNQMNERQKQQYEVQAYQYRSGGGHIGPIAATPEKP